MNNNESRRNRIEKRAMLRRQSAGAVPGSAAATPPVTSLPSTPVGMPSAFYLPSPTPPSQMTQTATSGAVISTPQTAVTPSSGGQSTPSSSSSLLTVASPSLSSSASSAFLSLPPTPSSYLVPNQSPSPSPVPGASSSAQSMPSPFPSFMSSAQSMPSPFSPNPSAAFLTNSGFVPTQFSSSSSAQQMVMPPQGTLGVSPSASMPMMASSMTATPTATVSSEPMMSPSISSPTSSPPPTSPLTSPTSMTSPSPMPPDMNATSSVPVPSSSQSSVMASNMASSPPNAASLQMMMKAFPQMAYMMGMPTMSMGGMPGIPPGMAASAMGAMAAMPAMSMPMPAMAGMPAMGAMPLWMPTSMGMMPMTMPYPGMPTSMGMPMMPMPYPYPTMAMPMSMPSMAVMTPYGPMQMPIGPNSMPTTTTTTTTSSSPRSSTNIMKTGPQPSADPTRMSAMNGPAMMPPGMMGMPMTAAGFPPMVPPTMTAVGPSVPDTDARPENAMETSEDGNKRKRPSRPYVKPVRIVRPKFTQEKGVQCEGMNIKKRTRCRNAALMEYIGEQPVYCAEHIEQDPSSLYCKCQSPYLNEPGDKKRCKEIVLKEFGYCYKHYGMAIEGMTGKEGYMLACSRTDKLASLLNQLCEEAASAKKKDGDMYQRKTKLIHKLQQMYTTLNSHVTALGSQLMKEAERSIENARNMTGQGPPPIPQIVEPREQHSTIIPVEVNAIPMGDPSLPEHDASLAASALVALPHCDVAPVMHQVYSSTAPTALLDLSARGEELDQREAESEVEDSDGEEVHEKGDIPKHKEIEPPDEGPAQGPVAGRGEPQHPLILLDPANSVLGNP